MRTRIRRIGLWAVGALLLLAAAAAGTVAGLQTDAGRRAFAGWLSDRLSDDGRRVLFGRIEGALPFAARLVDVSVADSDGVWLVVADAEIAWSPMALLAGRLQVDRLVVGRAALARAPLTPDDAPPAGPLSLDLPTLPLTLRVDDVAVRELSLAAPVLGQAAAVAISGSAALGAGDAALRLTAQRIDGAAGRVELDFGRGATGALTLRADIEEPSGGLIARALDLPGLPAVRLRLAGAGPPDDWRGRLEATAGAARLDAAVGVGLGDAVSVALDGRVLSVAVLAPDLAALVPPAIDLMLDLAWRPDRRLNLDRLVLSAPGANLDLRATVDLDDGALEGAATASLAGARLAGLLAPAAAEAARVEATFAGTLAAPRLDATVTLERPSLDAARAALLTARLDSDAGGWPAIAVTGEGRIEGLTLGADVDLAALTGADTVDWSFAGAVDALSGELRFDELSVVAGRLNLDGSGRLADNNRALDATVRADLADLAPLAALAGLEAGGRLTLEARLGGDPAAPDVELSGTASDLALVEPALAALLGNRVGIAGKIGLVGATIRFDDVTIDGANARLTASGEVADEIAADWRLELPRLAALSDALGMPLDGALSVAGDLGGAVADPRLSLEATGAALSLDGVSLDRLRLRLTAAGLAAPQGDLDIAVESHGIAASAAADYAVEDGTALRLDGLRVTGPATELVGDLRLALDSGLIDGRLSGTIGDLAAWAPLHGTATVAVAAAADGSQQTVDLRLDGAAVSLSEPATTTARASLTARLADAFGTPTLTAELTLAETAAAGVWLREVRFAAAGDLAQLNMELRAAGEIDRPFALDAVGQLALTAEGESLRLDRLEATLGAATASLVRPATVTRQGGVLTLDGLDATVGGGRLTAAARLSATAVTADATLADLPLGFVSAFLAGPPLDGTLSAELTLSGDPAAPDGRLEARLSGLAEPGVAAERAVVADGRLQATLTGGRLEATAEIGGPSELAATAALSAPLAFGVAPFELRADPAQAISGRLDGRLDLALVPRVLDLRGDVLAGRLDVEMALSGAVGEPRVAGEAHLSGGRYENAATGAVLRDVTLVAVGDNDRIVLRSVAANDGNGGTLTGSGVVTVAPGRGFPFAGELALRNMAVLRRDDATVQASGDLRLDDAADGVRLSGDVTVDGAELRIPDRLPAELVALEVEEINRPAARPKRAPAAAPQWSVALDIVVDTPGKAFLRGRGLDSEWRGQLRLGGTIAAPTLAGRLAVVRGTLDFFGKTFVVDDGSIRFINGAEIDADLDFVAVAEAADLVARMRVLGTLSAPAFELTSDPALPPDEILARLLFGETVSTLTPFQAVQLAQAAASLAGTGGSAGILDNLRRRAGLDALGVTAGEDGAAGSSVSVGKYVTKNVFVTVDQGLTPESRKVGVEVRVLPSVTVETDVGAAGDGKIGLNWRWNY